MRTMIGLLILFGMLLRVNADPVSLSVCRLDNDRFQFSVEGDIDGWWFNNFISADLETLIASGEGTEFVIYYDGNTESIFATPDTPLCVPADAWKPSAPSILIPAREGVFKLEIWGDNQWWLVTDEKHPDGIILTAKNGVVELIGSVGQDTDPAHYRLIEVTS